MNWEKFFKNITIFILAISAVVIMITYLYRTMSIDGLLQPIIINIISGIFVSFLFLYLLLNFLRPSFNISQYICSRNNKFYFKTVNRSIYHAFDAKFELFLMQPYSHTGGNTNVRIKPIALKTSNMTHINRYRRRYHKKDPFALFANSVFTEYDIATPLREEGAYLEFKITVRHGLTGLADTFTQHFPDDSVIMNAHKFCFGKNLATIPENQSV